MRRHDDLIWASLSTLMLAILCPALNAADKNPVSRLMGRQAEKTDYRMVGEDTSVDGMLPIKVEAIGLVWGLQGTGSDPAPTRYRAAMLEFMRKREVANPERLLASDTTAIVLLRGYIPPGTRKGDMIDVEVWVPPNDTTTSLKGGRILETSMHEQVIARGRFTLEGDPLVKVKGLVLCMQNPDAQKDSASLRKGKILGQGRVMIDRDFRLVLHKEARSGLKAKRIARQINQRFYSRHAGRRIGLANAKNDKVIELKLAEPYRYDIQRYLLVVRRIPLSDSPTFRQVALTQLRDDLQDPGKALEAALRLEALGKDSTPVLQAGLDHNSQLVRFACAQSLAYLGNSSGVPQLAQLARSTPEYRAYALTALVALDHPVSRIELAKLLDEESVHVRYGAFRSLWAMNKTDPIVGGEPIGEEFSLHLIPSSSEPVVHVSRNFRREIVLFGNRQQLIPPMSLWAGNSLFLSAEAGSDHVVFSLTKRGPEGTIRRYGRSSLVLADILREAARLEATYPDVVDLLRNADQNHNLMGRLEINALPPAVPLGTLAAQATGQENDAQEFSHSSGPTLFADTGARNPLVGENAFPDNDSKQLTEGPASSAEKKQSFFQRIFSRFSN